jgi:hypothetical protein
MATHPNIGFDKFPKQGSEIGKQVKVTFNYEFNKMIMGTVLRDDIESPHLMIIQLADGRVILSTECQYQ